MNPPSLWQKTRQGSRRAIARALARHCRPSSEKTGQIEALAAEYDSLLYRKCGHSINAYRLRFRRDLTALRSSSTTFAADLASGAMSMEAFAALDDSELVSDNRKRQDAAHVERGIAQCIGKKMVDNINEVKQINTFSREKWGISDSAAKVDPECDD